MRVAKSAAVTAHSHHADCTWYSAYIRVSENRPAAYKKEKLFFHCKACLAHTASEWPEAGLYHGSIQPARPWSKSLCQSRTPDTIVLC